MGGQRQRFEIAFRGRQQPDLDFRGRPIAGDGQLFLAVVGDPDRRFCRARELDRGDRFHAETALGAKAAADMVGDDAHLVVRELVTLAIFSITS